VKLCEQYANDGAQTLSPSEYDDTVKTRHSQNTTQEKTMATFSKLTSQSPVSLRVERPHHFVTNSAAIAMFKGCGDHTRVRKVLDALHGLQGVQMDGARDAASLRRRLRESMFDADFLDASGKARPCVELTADALGIVRAAGKLLKLPCNLFGGGVLTLEFLQRERASLLARYADLAGRPADQTGVTPSGGVSDADAATAGECGLALFSALRWADGLLGIPYVEAREDGGRPGMWTVRVSLGPAESIAQGVAQAAQQDRPPMHPQPLIDWTRMVEAVRAEAGDREPLRRLASDPEGSEWVLPGTPYVMHKPIVFLGYATREKAVAAMDAMKRAAARLSWIRAGGEGLPPGFLTAPRQPSPNRQRGDATAALMEGALGCLPTGAFIEMESPGRIADVVVDMRQVWAHMGVSRKFPVWIGTTVARHRLVERVDYVTDKVPPACGRGRHSIEYYAVPEVAAKALAWYGERALQVGKRGSKQTAAVPAAEAATPTPAAAPIQAATHAHTLPGTPYYTPQGHDVLDMEF
jgi:hypothetical protein